MPDERAAERRMNDPAYRQPAQEQHDQAVDIGGLAEQVEAKPAEDRPDLHPLQPVIAAGQPARLVDRLVEHRGDDQGQHQQGEPRRTQDDEARQQPDQRRGRRSGKKPGDRLAPAMGGKEPRGIGAGAEKRGLAQGDDSGIAEHQIGRQREKDRRQDLRAQRQIGREGEIGRNRRNPRHRFERVVAVAPGKAADRAGTGHQARPNRPRGRHNSTARVKA